MDQETTFGKNSLENPKADWSAMVHWVEFYEPKLKTNPFF